MNLIIMVVMTVLTAACGKDSGIAVNLHEKAKPTPPSIEQKAIAALEGLNVTDNSDSASSFAIRSQLIGVNADFSTGTEVGTTNVLITLSQRHGADQCSVRTFSGILKNAEVGKVIAVPELGRMQCLDKTCEFILIVIEKSANQMSTSQGEIAAAVPIILEDRSHDKKISSGAYGATASESSLFLELQDDDNIRCNAPVEVTSNVGPMLPDSYQPDYTYFPLDEYNTWR